MSDVTQAASDRNDPWAATLSPGRIEALTDGVMAIAMTILVLELPVPHLLGSAGSGEHPASFLDMWDEFYIYVTGFIVLGIYWILHHYMFHFIKRSDGVLVWLNIVFLVLAALVPYATKVLQVNEVLFRDIQDAGWDAAGGFFAITTMASILVLLVMWQYATRRHRLVARDIDERIVSVLNRIILIGIGINFVGVILSVFYAPAGLLSFVAMAYMIMATAYGHHRPVKRKAKQEA